MRTVLWSTLLLCSIGLAQTGQPRSNTSFHREKRSSSHCLEEPSDSPFRIGFGQLETREAEIEDEDPPIVITAEKLPCGVDAVKFELYDCDSTYILSISPCGPFLPLIVPRNSWYVAGVFAVDQNLPVLYNVNITVTSLQSDGISYIPLHTQTVTYNCRNQQCYGAAQ